MKAKDIDFDKIIRLLLDVPEDFDIQSIDLTNNNYTVKIKYDYKSSEDERIKMLSRDYQKWVSEMDKYFEKLEKGDPEKNK